MIRNNRLAEQANEIVGAMMFARSEALKRGIRVSVCPGLNDTCSGAMDWNAGIVVFTDDTGTIGVRDSTDVVLRTWRPRNNGFVSSGGATSVSFVRSGAAAATQIDIYKSGCTGPNVRRVAVAVTGRVQSSKENCS
jgi:type IV fimbrial biogenesis protein FimT